MINKNLYYSTVKFSFNKVLILKMSVLLWSLLSATSRLEYEKIDTDIC